MWEMVDNNNDTEADVAVKLCNMQTLMTFKEKNIAK